MYALFNQNGMPIVMLEPFIAYLHWSETWDPMENTEVSLPYNFRQAILVRLIIDLLLC